MTRAPVPGDRPIKTLERVLSKAGVGSRKESRRIIEAGRVSVNGRIERDPDLWIDLERDVVSLDGRPLPVPEPVYILLNKPTGYLTTLRDPKGRPTVYDLLPPELRRLRYVGRLDNDTSGLLLLTSDHALIQRVADPAHGIEKTYRIVASPPLAGAQVHQLVTGVELLDGPTFPARAAILEQREDATVLALSIREGRNRQVRRMIEAVGSRVLELERTHIGGLAIGTLPRGEFRRLEAEDLEALFA